MELLSAGQVNGHTALQRLGPDLLAPDFDEAEALARLRAATDLEIADALLDQSIVAGIGNVYKSEVLFLERVSPFARVASLDDDTLHRCCARTAGSAAQRGTSERRTTHCAQRAALWVYDRAANRASVRHADTPGLQGHTPADLLGPPASHNLGPSCNASTPFNRG